MDISRSVVTKMYAAYKEDKAILNHKKTGR